MSRAVSWMIRDLEPADLTAAGALAKSAGFPAYRAEALAAVQTRPGGVMLVVAPPGSAAVGGLAVLEVVVDEAELHWIGVAPELRGRGWGARLLRAGMARVGARGAEVVHLEVGASNRAARALYARQGFVAVGHRRGYYAGGEDALLLSARLRRGRPKPESTGQDGDAGSS